MVPANSLQDDRGLYLAGIKSYGRAPTFLMITGYEQVRSIAADIAGDREAAERVELELPETGVCTRGGVEGGCGIAGCCGGPAPAEVTACCARRCRGQGRRQVRLRLFLRMRRGSPTIGSHRSAGDGADARLGIELLSAGHPRRSDRA